VGENPLRVSDMPNRKLHIQIYKLVGRNATGNSPVDAETEVVGGMKGGWGLDVFGGYFLQRLIMSVLYSCAFILSCLDLIGLDSSLNAMKVICQTSIQQGSSFVYNQVNSGSLSTSFDCWP
jgi:hypothetical protein